MTPVRNWTQRVYCLLDHKVLASYPQINEKEKSVTHTIKQKKKVRKIHKVRTKGGGYEVDDTEIYEENDYKH